MTASWLCSLSDSDRQAFLSSLTSEEKAALNYQWSFWARDAQLPPQDDTWLVWLILAGRGFGKTRTGAEWVREEVEQGRRSRIALVAETAADARDVMVEGESGILAISPPWFAPKYEPSKRRLTWPNGAIATTYSAEDPEQLRGPQHDGAWCDEIAKWRYAETYDNLMFGMRLGAKPRVVATTTPRKVKLLQDLIALPTTRVTSGSTYDNLMNLAPTFQAIISKYEGTRLGEQELHAKMLADNPDALWKRDAMLDALRVKHAPALIRILVGVDPAATGKDTSDETGSIVAGKAENGHAYILDDRSLKSSPHGWATAAVNAYTEYKADRLVAEVNQGGDMVENTIRTVEGGLNVSYLGVRATRGKYTRAEPIAALYEQGKVHHVGTFSDLEDQLCNWTPGEDSPDRLDALVWALTELMLDARGDPLVAFG